MLKGLFSYKFSLLLLLIISVLSLLPSSGMPESRVYEIPGLDKFVHFSMYTVLTVVALLENRCRVNCLRIRIYLMLAIFLLSICMEVLQATVIISRSAEWADLIANLCGVLFGYFLIRLLYMIRSWPSLYLVWILLQGRQWSVSKTAPSSLFSTEIFYRANCMANHDYIQKNEWHRY